MSVVAGIPVAVYVIFIAVRIERQSSLDEARPADLIIIMGAAEMDLAGMTTMLRNEKFMLQQKQKEPTDAVVIVRAHKDVDTGKVQEVIKACQAEKFDHFILRAKEKNT